MQTTSTYGQGVYPFNNPLNTGLLNNPLGNNSMSPTNSLCLNQIQNFEPVKKFKDEMNTEWSLVKASSDSTVDVPSPKSMQVIDFWNHEFPNIKTKLYVYVVEGIRQPRIETEQPTRILYQWFSTVFVPTFTPQMISDREWLKANVYAAPIVNGRVSKLKALCHIADDANMPETHEDKLLNIEELNGNSRQANQVNQGTSQQQYPNTTGANQNS